MKTRLKLAVVVLAGLILSGTVVVVAYAAARSDPEISETTRLKREYQEAHDAADRRVLESRPKDYVPPMPPVDPNPMASQCGMFQPRGSSILPNEAERPSRYIEVTNVAHVVTTMLDVIDVWAGADRYYPESGDIFGDPNQGVIWLLVNSTCGHETTAGGFFSPEKRGALTMIKAEPDVITFEYAHGGIGTFNLITNAFGP